MKLANLAFIVPIFCSSVNGGTIRGSSANSEVTNESFFTSADLTAQNICPVASGPVACASIYEPVLCGHNDGKARLCKYPSLCAAQNAGFTSLSDCIPDKEFLDGNASNGCEAIRCKDGYECLNSKCTPRKSQLEHTRPVYLNHEEEKCPSAKELLQCPAIASHPVKCSKDGLLNCFYRSQCQATSAGFNDLHCEPVTE